MENKRYFRIMKPASFRWNVQFVKWLHKRYFRHPGKLIDLGCGQGEVVETFKRLGYEAEGYDYPKIDLEKKLKFKDKTYDFVICKFVFEHIHNIMGLMEEIRRILKPNGLAVILTDDAPSNWGCPEPKWHLPGSREGLSPQNVDALAENPELAFMSREGPLGELGSIERALRVIDVFLASELMLTEQWRSSVKATYPYHETYIPLKGYHPLDFSVNNDVQTWRGMVDRGYEATVTTLLDAGLIADTGRKRNPYRLQGRRK